MSSVEISSPICHTESFALDYVTYCEELHFILYRSPFLYFPHLMHSICTIKRPYDPQDCTKEVSSFLEASSPHSPSIPSNPHTPPPYTRGHTAVPTGPLWSIPSEFLQPHRVHERVDEFPTHQLEDQERHIPHSNFNHNHCKITSLYKSRDH